MVPFHTRSKKTNPNEPNRTHRRSAALPRASRLVRPLPNRYVPFAIGAANMFQKILVANRGEIAVRVTLACQQMGIRAVAVYSEPDRDALHVAAADEAHLLEGMTPSETYLRGDRIIDIARSCGAAAVHPGYGFLSENADFAQACADADLTFIGPKPEVIRALGDKLSAKKTFEDIGVPVIPSWSGHQSPKRQRGVRPTADNGSAAVPPTHANDVQSAASRIGYALLVKAAAGGGGRGMRLVERESDLIGAVESARHEAGAAFGDSRVFLEKYLVRPRHVEIQILADAHGNVVHLFERECSIQRRHQKIIEESPSPALTADLRQRMGEAAVTAARAVGYTNAGTVECMVDEAGNFYFLEVNTRLQVEHPVTEMVTQQDLVRAQILIAAGEPLPFAQGDLTQTGHAIEARIYAEDPGRNFMPSIGTLHRYSPPTGPNIRVDSGVAQGGEVGVHYDAMLAKLIVWGVCRTEARLRLAWALDRFIVLGVKTNIEFLRNLTAHPDFRSGNFHAQFLDDRPIITDREAPPEDALIAAAVTASQAGCRARGVASTDGRPAHNNAGPWRLGHAWRVS